MAVIVSGIDPIDDRLAVGAVLRDRHPDVLAVIVDAAGMIDRAFAELQFADEIALQVDLEQVRRALARVAVIAVDRLRKALGRRLDLDRRHENIVADLHHALRMVGEEIDRHRLDLFPCRATGELGHLLGGAAALLSAAWRPAPLPRRKHAVRHCKLRFIEGFSRLRFVENSAL